MLQSSFRCPHVRRAIRGFSTTAFRQGLAQTHHTFNAQFLSIGHDGVPRTEPFQAFTEDLSYPGVFIPGRIGKAFRSGIVTASSSSVHSSSDRIPLIFYHDAQAFASSEYLPFRICLLATYMKCIESTPIPRLMLPHDLPRQTNTNESPATLFIFNAGHVITLNGTEAGRTKSLIRCRVY